MNSSKTTKKLDTRENLVIANGNVITPDIVSWEYNGQTNQLKIVKYRGEVHNYNYDNVVWMQNPIALIPDDYQIVHRGRVLNRITEIYEFTQEELQYWHIFYENGSERDYNRYHSCPR